MREGALGALKEEGDAPSRASWLLVDLIQKPLRVRTRPYPFPEPHLFLFINICLFRRTRLLRNGIRCLGDGKMKEVGEDVRMDIFTEVDADLVEFLLLQLAEIE